MSKTFWRPSATQRQTILLLEALGLIHDLGKLSDTFLQSQAPSSTLEYNHTLLADPRQVPMYCNSTAASNRYVQEWLNDAANKHCAFGERSDLTNILDQIKFNDWSGEAYSFAELIPFVARPGIARSTTNWRAVLGKEMQPGLLVGYMHGAAHIEKEGEPDQHKQHYNLVFRATPFGMEEQIATDTGQELTNALKSLPLHDLKHITTDQRSDWLVRMKALMSRGPADNRRPHNEVSLWDWGYTVATLTKAAAVWIFKNGWPAYLREVPYRTLRVNLDILACYMHSNKMSDLLGVRETLKNSFDRVQILLEETYALGNCFYHDETGAYYLLPDIFDDAGIAALREEIQANFPKDLQPQVHLENRVTVGEIDQDKSLSRKLVTEPRTASLKSASVLANNNLYLFETEWTEGRPENAEVCMVCGVRPIGYPLQHSQPEVERELATWATPKKARQRNICRVCLDRRGRRAEQWAHSDLQGTIWMDEVADRNGRLALLVGKLGLEEWLSGTLLSTIEVTRNTAKHPSPARLFRIAETARAFWEQVINKLTTAVVPPCPFRLALYPRTIDLSDLGDFHAYELDVHNVALSVLWDKPNNRFLTVDNLMYVTSQSGIVYEEIIEQLQGKTYQLLESSAFLQPGQPLLKIHIEYVDKLPGYQPTIPLLAEPGICLLLMPADKAVELVHRIKQEYEKQMGRVRDRLPLYLGLVFSHRRTPMSALLDAGRSMLHMDPGEVWEGWRLEKKLVTTNPVTNRRECTLNFDHGITWNIPVVAGDNQICDRWYPKMYEGISKTKTQVKHVTELRERNKNIPKDGGWKVWVRPGRFDFEFLDTTARRFAIYYDANGRRMSRRTRPFYLEDLDRLQMLWNIVKKLTRSQRQQIIRTIEATREAWYGADSGADSLHDAVFRQFVTDTLARAAWPGQQRWDANTHTWVSTANHSQPGGWHSVQEWHDQLVQAGVSGELTDLAELHMEILKER